jgi:hypothetical protein
MAREGSNRRWAIAAAAGGRVDARLSVWGRDVYATAADCVLARRCLGKMWRFRVGSGVVRGRAFVNRAWGGRCEGGGLELSRRGEASPHRGVAVALGNR